MNDLRHFERVQRLVKLKYRSFLWSELTVAGRPAYEINNQQKKALLIRRSAIDDQVSVTVYLGDNKGNNKWRRLNPRLEKLIELALFPHI